MSEALRIFEPEDAEPEPLQLVTERIRLFGNAIRIAVEGPDTPEKKEIMNEIEADIEDKFSLHIITDAQRIALLRCLYGHNRVAVYYYDPSKANTKGRRK